MSVYLLLAGSFDALDESEQCVLVYFLFGVENVSWAFLIFLKWFGSDTVVRESYATLGVNQIRIVNITTDFPSNINSQSCRRLSVY